MAQATNYFYDYFAGMSIKSGVVYTSAAILTAYPTAKIIELRTDDVKVSINGTDAIMFHSGDIAYIVSGKTWVFTKDCEVAIGTVIDLMAP